MTLASEVRVNMAQTPRHRNIIQSSIHYFQNLTLSKVLCNNYLMALIVFVSVCMALPVIKPPFVLCGDNSGKVSITNVVVMATICAGIVFMVGHFVRS